MSQTAPPDVAVPPTLFCKTGIYPGALDEDAVKVVARLRRKGHETFLVGGCVRDLLLSRRPKDFDVATSARPRQIKTLFRNCRIIGRRFKLAHLHFDDKILEVSTFRQRPEQEEDDDLLIRSDNSFGTANEDAHRRDFTINALFLNPEDDCIHDYVGGIADIEAGVVRTIGDPLVRIKEDPVRILRAVKFASRLSLRIDGATWQAMCDAAEDLSRSAPPRLLEELLRLMRSGTALQAFQLLRDCGALSVLLPEIGDYLNDVSREQRLRFWRMVEAVDGRVRLTKDVTSPVLFGALLFPLFEAAQGDSGEGPGGREADSNKLAETVIGPVLKRLNFSRAESGRLKRICVVQRRFGGTSSRRSFRPMAFLKQEFFPEALALLHIRCIATDEHWDEYDEWSRRYEEAFGKRQDSRDTDANGRDGNDAERGRNRRRRKGKGAPAKQEESRSTKRGRRKSKRKKRAREEPLPPLPPIQLDPHEVPTYGSVLGDTGSAEKIELESSKGKRARKKKKTIDEPYVPPPPPEVAVPKRDEDPDVFGDW